MNKEDLRNLLRGISVNDLLALQQRNAASTTQLHQTNQPRRPNRSLASGSSNDGLGALQPRNPASTTHRHQANQHRRPNTHQGLASGSSNDGLGALQPRNPASTTHRHQANQHGRPNTHQGLASGSSNDGLGALQPRNPASTTHRHQVNQHRRPNNHQSLVLGSDYEARPRDTNVRNRKRFDEQYTNNVEKGSNSNKTKRDTGRNYMGFKKLQELNLNEPKYILEQLNEKRDQFLELVNNSMICNDNKDMLVLVLEILSKVCLSSFDELKQKLLLDVFKTSFLMHITNYLMNLHYTEANDKRKNTYYWNNQDQFWQNFITISECIFNVVPSVALQKLRPLLDLCNVSLDVLNTRHGFKLSDNNQINLAELRVRLAEFEQKENEKKCQREHNTNSVLNESEPPENFRELSVIPSRDELLVQRPFLRANVVRGGYRDVEHYLDVQYRLLREDCFGPLREGLVQFVENPAKQKFDNIRVFRNVRVSGPYVNKSHVGVIVQLDENTVKRQRRINWAYSKRFIFGSLLLFTDDNCRSFIPATIIDRDVKNLTAGRIPVSVIETPEDPISMEFKSDVEYVMIESEVYFEPYLHVLKVLKNPRFAQKLSMKKYIVDVEPEATPPSYLDFGTSYSVKCDSLSVSQKSITVLQSDTWPSCEQLGLNESQYEAFKLALTHEFAVIQGPPGTGKTFLGVKVAETLLKNIQEIQEISEDKTFMLVVCYTNHALDQFLEHILKITNSVVRIGGQSRNEAMANISLNKLRSASESKGNHALKLYLSEKHNLKVLMAELQTAQGRIKSLQDGILSYDNIKEYVPEAALLEQYYGVEEIEGGDILWKWLFENMPYVDVEQGILEGTEDIIIENNDEDEDNTRVEVVLDDIFETDYYDVNGTEVKTSFLLERAEQALKYLILSYRRSTSIQERQRMKVEIGVWNSRIKFFTEMKYLFRGDRQIGRDENLKRLPYIDRWSLYFTWANRVITSIKENIKPLQDKVNNAVASYDEARMCLDLRLIERKRVVGMTTSGAARLRKLLEALAPPIVIVEEAAEVLEQHIVTALPPSCKHLILIGDHQQLRPSAAYMKLARHYKIDISLFERMVANGMHSRRLGVQHRMRPEIAALISPHIYEDLANHPSVEAFPHVRGITTDLFFFTHNYMEEAVEDTASRCNYKEADMTLKLANYLMQQGYQPEDITILAAYTGQMFYMKKQRSKYVFLQHVKITVVDNYQGEESKIILLSLVRNNDQNKIGFLGTENRICVALSRAKQGFYIFGNINILKGNSKLWTNIASTLEEMGAIGTELRLKCENHVDQFSRISSPKDFEKVPEGGCLLKCNYNLPECGHRCPRICHGYDLGHSDVKCLVNCERIICELRHPCPLKCGQKCTPCRQKVVKTLPCGHSKEIYCHQEPDDPFVQCTVVVSVQLALCGHTAKKPCHMDLAKVVCMVPCNTRVECGHQCRRRCHVTDDPDHEEYQCEKPCAKPKRGCTANLVGDRGNHQCPRRCHETCEDCKVEVSKKRSNCKHSDTVPCCEDVNETPCRKNCARIMACGHFCKKKCHEPCGDCNIKVEKTIPGCGHSIKLPCKEEPKQEMCLERCERKLSCGHKCTMRCGKKCDVNVCVEVINREFKSPCGHRVKLPCNAFERGLSDPELVMSYCTAPCNTTLKCDHVCAGTCAQCHQGRIHVACAQPCHVIMICGHKCEEPCNQLCPPCRKPCEVMCGHSRCKRLCGAPCVSCQEPCERECPHGQCRRRCGEACGRAACDEACGRALPCGHACRGLCGEPCPDICRLCRPDDFPKDFLGYDFEDDAKFIKLQDCSHVMEVDDADNLMKGDKETISIRSCPFCRKPIINTYRYKDLVNEMYKKQINPIKEKVYGTEAQVKEKTIKLSKDIAEFAIQNQKLIQENSYYASAFEALPRTFKKKVSALQLDMHSIYIEILGIIAKYYKQFNDARLIELKKEFFTQIRLICGTLQKNIQKISQQQQQDIGCELKRMNSIIQLSKLLSHTSYRSKKEDPKVAAAANKAKLAIISKSIYTEDVAVLALKTLEETVKLSGIVTKQERDLVVKAIGLKQGHWYKCPNGHFYCIGECGGAMQQSFCIECKAPIGGQSHQLLSTNSHAGELDGSRFAAWSNEYNNMRNFDLGNMH